MRRCARCCRRRRSSRSSRAPSPSKPPPAGGGRMGMVSWVADGSQRAGLPAAARRQGRPGRWCSTETARWCGRGARACTPRRMPSASIRRGTCGRRMRPARWSTSSRPRERRCCTIEVGGQPSPCGGFCSTTDIAFAADGHLFIADGYRNARILEYSGDGKKLREWGSAGTGPGPVPPATFDSNR